MPGEFVGSSKCPERKRFMKTAVIKNLWSDWLKNLKVSDKIRIFIGICISCLLFAISWNYLYSGINKRLLLFAFLAFATGFFIAFPMPYARYLSVPISLLYLLYVPKKMFERIELPIHDMSGLMDGAYLVNELVILMIFVILFFLFQRAQYAFGIGGILILLASLINFYVYSFRGDGLNYSDIRAVGTAMTVVGNYHFFMNAELWYSILWFCFFISWGFWCKIPYKGVKYHVAVTAITTVTACSICFFFIKSDYVEDHGFVVDYWDMEHTEVLNGFLLGFGLTIKDAVVEKPEGYSEEKLQEIAATIGETISEPGLNEKKPNIIMIMNEAWSDLKVLGDLQTTEPYMPFTDSLMENVTKGNLHVGILGGFTANTEFEALMGDSLAFLPPKAIPYQAYFSRSLPSMASVLKEQGYQTMAMHPSVAFAWNRDKVYEAMGFEEFIDVDQFNVEYEHIRGFISDRCNFNEIIYQYEHREQDKPFFLFDVTIQNHGNYYREIDLPIAITRMGGIENPDAEEVQIYLNLIRITDDAFKELVNYFAGVKEPVIICMFGDHQPLLKDDVYDTFYENQDLTDEEELKRKYITPYVIWSNYDNDFTDYGDISANYLGAVLMECAGVDMPLYDRFLLEMEKEYPVLSRMGAIDRNGRSVLIKDLQEDKWFQEYEILQYSHLMDVQKRDYLFSVGK